MTDKQQGTSKAPSKKFLRNARIIGFLFVIFGIFYMALFSFNIVADVFGMFFVILGITAMIQPKAIRTVILIIVHSLPLSC